MTGLDLSERDRKLYESDTFSQFYRRALQEGFSQGAQGYAHYLVNALFSWPFKLEEITVPVDLWYGSLDTSTVHSPDFGATLALRLQNTERTREPNEGGSILWTKSWHILSKLKSHLFS